jgi:PLP dependent protein
MSLSVGGRHLLGSGRKFGGFGTGFAFPGRPIVRMSSASQHASSKTAATPPAVAASLAHVLDRVSAAALQSGRVQAPRLVAISKTKPSEAVREAYGAGHRHFGENYVQELVAKAAELPADIQWHFIGSLQSNKARALLSVPNLFCVETVDRAKTATALDRAAEACGRDSKLRILVQVNTSGEESKSGCTPVESLEVAAHVVARCPCLELGGLMTIGAPDDSEEPVAFRTLSETRDKVAQHLGIPADQLELSMGMSGDFEAAIRMGADSVRVGSLIFGARDYSAKA